MKKYLNPLNWPNGVVEMGVAFIFLARAIVHDPSLPIQESNDYLIFWILASTATIRFDIAALHKAK